MILQKFPDSDEYIRVGTLSVVTSQMEPELEMVALAALAGIPRIPRQSGVLTTPGYDFGARPKWQVRVKEFFQKEWELKEFAIV